MKPKGALKKVVGAALVVTVVLTSAVLGFITALPLIFLASFLFRQLWLVHALLWAGPVSGLIVGVFWARAMLRS